MAANDAQAIYWNEQAGPVWAAMQTLLDRQIAPLGVAALAALAPAPGERLLDIGCGCGDTSLALADAVGAAGAVLGVDLSAPMLAVARQRAEGRDTLTFRQQDAQTADFGAPWDAVFSRFGVMFFADPPAAFTNLRRALCPGGRLAFVCWRAPEANPWLTAPLAAAADLLLPAPPEEPDAPGPFAFADAARIRHILAAAGWRDVVVAPHDQEIGGMTRDEATLLALRVGPLGRAVREAPALAGPVKARVADALRGLERDGAVWLGAGVWIVTARA